jgi:peptidoglycan/LPS O-acetylase OafA/YrhL
MKGRNIGLDILRAAAIIGVVLCHGLTVKVAGQDILGQLGSGVELFFVLSGFLIGRIYLRSSGDGDFSFWQFWRSRWWRTLPPYVAGMLVYVGVGRFIASPGLPWYYCLFLQNYLGITGFGVSWSLCVEEHFYLLLPIVGIAVDRVFGRRSLAWILPLAFFAPTVMRILTLEFAQPLPPQWYFFTHLHCEGLITGVYLAYLFLDRPLVFARLGESAQWAVPLIPVTMLVYTFWDPRPPIADMFVCTLYAIGYGAWLLCSYQIAWTPIGPTGRLLRAGIQGVALCSYSVYLTHTTFDAALRGHLLLAMHRGPLKSLVVLSSTFLFGVIFYFLVERPTILSRDYFLHGKKVARLDPRPVVELS